jgi:hypothetical protein
MRLFDFSLKDNSLWDNRRGFWNNIGNLGTNVAGGVAGFVGTGFNPLGAAAGWSGANQAYDAAEQLITGDREGNALVDIGTVAAGGTAFSANAIGLTGGTTFGLVGGGAAGAASGGAATGGGGAGAAGGAASGGAGGGIASMLQNQAGNLAIDAVQGGAMALFNQQADKAKEAQERLEKIDYYERNKAAAEATFNATVDTVALKFLQNDLATRQQAFDFEMTGRMARSTAVVSAGASNLAGVSARETFNDISAQTSKGARRFQTQRKNASDSFFQDIINLQVARDNQINSVTDPRQFEVSDDIKNLQAVAPWIEFGVGMLGKVGDAVGQERNVADIREGRDQ